MKFLLSVILSVFLSNFIFAQNSVLDTKASFGQVEINKANVEAVSIKYPISKSDLEKIFEAKMKSLGLKSDEKVSKTVRKYAGVKVMPLSENSMDIFYTIAGDKTTSSATMTFSKGYDNYISSKEDQALYNNAKGFLESLNTEVDKLTINNQIEVQEKVIDKEIKNQKDLEDKLKDLIEKKKEVEAKIETTQKDLEKQNSRVTEEKTVLEKIKSKMK